MKTINIHNYEEFFIDFLDGVLSENEVSELNEFLKNHQELGNDFDGLKQIKLIPERIEFENKSLLIKQTQSKFFELTPSEYLAIAELENDITESEKIKLETELNTNSKKLNEYKIFKLTKLKPDLKITYQYKNTLYKQSINYFKRTVYYAAALIALLLTLNVFVLQKNEINNGTNLSALKNNNLQESDVNLKIKEENKSEQKTKNFHNQSIKQTNNFFAFNDIEPQSEVNLYKDYSESIPDLKQEALVINSKQPDLIPKQNIFAEEPKLVNKKEKFWQFAEFSLHIWKKVTSGEIEMNNAYDNNGNLEKLNLYASNFKISKTFYKQ